MTSETKLYLEAMFGGMAESDWLLIWSKEGEAPKSPNISRWARNVDEAVKAVQAAESEAGWHVYAGVLARGKSHGAKKRGGNADVVAMPGLWIDIDIAGVGHKTTGKLPGNTDEAVALLNKIGVAPSMIVHTGGGIHGYWLFNEAWRLNSDADREQAATLERAWFRTFQIHAATAGYTIDATFDLARVLRVPGTTNWKGETPTQCRMLSSSAQRYEPADLRADLPPEAFADKTAKAVVSNQIGNLVLLADATPPFDKLEALRQAEPKFDLAIKYQRKDFPRGDYSPSSYDFSLAATAAYAGWSEQEIANLLIWVRTQHKQHTRIEDARYYARTINTVMADAQRKRAVDELHGETVRVVGENPEDDRAGFSPTKEPITQDKRTRLLDFLTQTFGCRIRAVLKYKQDPPQYRLETGKSGIQLGNVDNLIGQGSIRSALAATDGHFLPKFNVEDWNAIAQALLDACAVVYTGPEATDRGAMLEWLNIYLDENPPGDLSEFSIKNQTPHYQGANGEFVCLYASHFGVWIYQRANQKLSSKALGILFRRVKGEPIQISHEVAAENGHPAKRSTRAVWRIPRERRALRHPEPEDSNGTGGTHPAVTIAPASR